MAFLEFTLGAQIDRTAPPALERGTRTVSKRETLRLTCTDASQNQVGDSQGHDFISFLP